MRLGGLGLGWKIFPQKCWNRFDQQKAAWFESNFFVSNALNITT